ncbi:ergosterol biosynthesis protein [Loxospora ochrophaea]|nr:ergosterol biosynthesis protein [Loxospora ochrophaea]
MAYYLPDHEGLLPKWLLLVSIISVGNSIQAYSTLSYTRRVYSGPKSGVTSLSSRTFGTWSLVSSIIRFYAAYNVSDSLIYQLTLWTYVIGIAHFTSEWLIFNSASMGKGLASPLIVASASLAWMLTQWGWYVR